MKHLVIFVALLGGVSASWAESKICSPTKSQQNFADYNNKYKNAYDALWCAGFGPLEPTRGGGGSQCVTYTPHPAVKHAAEVDEPVRGRSGAALCSYIDTKQNRAWYAKNFGIRSNKD